ncbi:hypothetical protein SNOG_15452 [Parastagonospora nodorum SN15]|uniref:Uncharacterized protein n=1 Tax=Phaeosphaeria nodorum (strain SN15 / ATCC MYA-4574 / FGSC 10173) TaxID=321614 RepID=Q0TYB3_PHANO|nr:hypothetical protein SNOG_15452 [Parastagonospora nodorum SN15]EAT77117.1 hypothetical protein SNOG_15452 [Parastagonospora nodorum SN15]
MTVLQSPPHTLHKPSTVLYGTLGVLRRRLNQLILYTTLLDDSSSTVSLYQNLCFANCMFALSDGFATEKVPIYT